MKTFCLAFAALPLFALGSWLGDYPPSASAQQPIAARRHDTAKVLYVAQVPEPPPTPVVVASAVIEGPQEVQPGDLLVLTAEKSDAASFAWMVFPKKSILPVDQGRKLVFASGQPGEYRFVLATAKGDVVAIAEHVVIVGNPPKPDPKPDPEPDPDPEPKPPPIPVGPAAPLVGRVTNASDAARLSAFYRQFAEVVKRDTMTLTTTDQFRTAHERSLRLAFEKTDLAGKYNLAPTINDIIKTAMGGTASGALDAAKRATLALTLEQIAAAIGG